MCDLYDGKVTVAEYFGESRPRRRMLRTAAEREVFRHRREGWWGLDCVVCRYRVVGFKSRSDAEVALLTHCFEDHRQG